VTVVRVRRFGTGMIRLVLCYLAAVGIAIAGQSTAFAAPSPAEIEAQIDAEWNTLEPIIEQYNEVHGQLQVNQAEADRLQQQLQPLQLQVDLALREIGDMAARAYMSGPNSAFNAVLTGGSPTSLADKLTMLDQLARTQRDQVSDVADLRDKYAAEKKKIDEVAAALKTQDADLAGKKTHIEKKIEELQRLRIQAYGAGGAPRGSFRTGPCPAVYTSDAGGRAAAKACSLIGKPYIWASAGPNGYDCSGLTLTAWGSVGVRLRHYTKWQWQETKPVSRAELKPGDLVFYYKDLHHMGIYVGDNTIVHAPRTGDNVRMAPLDRTPPVGFRRPIRG